MGEGQGGGDTRQASLLLFAKRAHTSVVLYAKRAGLLSLRPLCEGCINSFVFKITRPAAWSVHKMAVSLRSGSLEPTTKLTVFGGRERRGSGQSAGETRRKQTVPSASAILRT